MKSSHRPEHFSRFFVLLGLLATAASCNDSDEHFSRYATAQFSEPLVSIAENHGETELTLRLDQPAPASGQILLKAHSVVPTCFSTTPVAELGMIKLNVTEGDTKVTFKMAPNDNQNIDGTKTIRFAISSMSSGLVSGFSREMVVTVTDDEGPVDAGFESPSLQVRESDQHAGKINIGLSKPAAADGILVLELESSSNYGVEYATEPAATNGRIFLPVSKGATSAMVKLYSINDQLFKADRNIYFTLIDATGGVIVGSEDSFWATITEDDGYEISSILDIRSMYGGESLIIQGDTYVEGIVTSISNVLAGRVVIEDATGALPIQFSASNNLTRGDIVLVNIKQALLHEFHGVLEVGQVTSFQRLGEEAVRVNKLTMEELFAADYRFESQTVQLTGVSFTHADGALTLLGDRLLTDGDRTIIVRTGTTAGFGNDIVPTGLLNVTGIFTKSDGLYILYPQEAKDIRKQQFMLRRD